MVNLGGLIPELVVRLEFADSPLAESDPFRTGSETGLKIAHLLDRHHPTSAPKRSSFRAETSIIAERSSLKESFISISILQKMSLCLFAKSISSLGLHSWSSLGILNTLIGLG